MKAFEPLECANPTGILYLQEARVPGQGARLAEMLRVSRLESEYPEMVLSRIPPEFEQEASLQALGQDIPLDPGAPTADEVFLQTRTVSLEEARAELQKWQEPGLDICAFKLFAIAHLPCFHSTWQHVLHRWLLFAFTWLLQSI